MMERERQKRHRVKRSDRQLDELLLLHGRVELWQFQGHMTERLLDRDFPKRGCADHDVVLVRLQQFSKTLAEPLIAAKPPENHMRIEKKPHGSSSP